MVPRAVSDLAARLGAEVHADPAAQASGFATDSRHVQPGDLFLAIRGERVDGHDFVAKAQVAGAVASLVERPVDTPHLLVDDLVQALARMATSFRDEFDGLVVGVTGSAGKTTAKELLAAALSPLGKVLKNEGNRNTEYTSPLVWADLEPCHRAAVIEMGMRGFGQIAHLASFSRPTIGVITNIGYAHLELVRTREGIARAKGELLQALPEGGVAVLWQGDEYLPLLKQISPVRTVAFGFEEDADCRIERYDAKDWQSAQIEGLCHGQKWKAQIPAVGRHVATSAAAAVLAAVEAGVTAADAGEALRYAKFAPMRMEVLHRNGVSILLDTYNASPPSMLAALETFCELQTAGRRLAILGEMRELGDFTESAHRNLGQKIGSFPLDEVVFYGEPMALAQTAAAETGFPLQFMSYAKSIDELRKFVRGARAGDAILIKGSRSLELERALE